MKPDAKNYKPEPQYLRDLLERAGLTQRAAALQLGIPERTFRDNLNGNKPNSTISYTGQFALECLAGLDINKKTHE